MDGYGNDEQRAAYRDALLVEKAGYAQRVTQAKSVGDENAVALYQSHMDQVDAEVARVDGVDDDDAGLSPEQRLAKAKNVADYDALAAELGYEFADGVSTKADKKAALEEYLAA
jgi:TPR repeat protein